jgi:hypothetical protein
MLQIKRIVRYNLPRYPRGGQYVYPPSTAGARVRDVAALLALAALIESCGDTSTGGVPLPPRSVSEASARQIITQVFTGRTIALDSSQVVTIPLSAADTLVLNVDGFNDSLQVGYEYVLGDDELQFPPAVCNTLDSLNESATPHILSIDPEVQRAAAEAHLQQVVQQFLDTLAAHGVI